MEILDRLLAPITRAFRRFGFFFGLGLLLILAFGWPSLYRYERLADQLVRINRITGRSWVTGTKGSEVVWWPIREP